MDDGRAEAVLAGEKRLLEMVATGCPVPAVLETLCRVVEEIATGCLCSVLLVDRTGHRVHHGAAPSLPSSYTAAIDGRAVAPDAGPCGMAAYQKLPVIVSDAASDSRWDSSDWRALALAHDLQSCWSTPILSQTGAVLGTFAIYRHEPGIPGAVHRSLIDRFTHIASVAIERAQSQQALESAFREIQELKDRLQRENIALREEVDQVSMFEEVVGTSPALRVVLAHISKVAPTESTVLITGETGTGKELVARAIHKRSARAAAPFITVNCAAVPPSLIASELFGHEKGAFTGAVQRRQGRFELADGGTIFLDEVGELPAETQVALLRVLQEREFERVGGNRPIRVNVRVIAATNRDLHTSVAEKSFRPDLFYRLNVFPLDVPPLRARRTDIPILVEYFTHRYARRAGKRIHRVGRDTLDLLQHYQWPGNIRELQNVIERAVIISESDTLVVDGRWFSAQEPPRTLLGREKDAIESALAEAQGRVAGPFGAAAKLGLPSSTLESKIRTLKIDKRRFKPSAPTQ